MSASGLASQRLERSQQRVHVPGATRPPASTTQNSAAAIDSPFSDPTSILRALKDGDVVLLKATWLLARAGFAEEEEPVKRTTVRVWKPSVEPQPLPNRQQIEADFPEAIMPIQASPAASHERVRAALLIAAVIGDVLCPLSL